MKKRNLITALALTLTLLCGITIGAGASSTLQEIKAYLNPGITIKYNGEEKILKDANGSRLYPIIYKGSTYLPIRAVAELAGLGVDWDQATQSVLLGDPADGVDLIEAYKPYTALNDIDKFYQKSAKQTASPGGVDVDHWILFKYTRWTAEDRVISFNIEGKYSTLTFKAYADVNTTLTIKGDNDFVLGEYDLVGGQVPKTVTVNLLNTTQLSFIRSGKDYSYCYIFDTILE